MSAANGRPCSCDGQHANRRLQSAPHVAIIRINEFIVASQLYAAARGALPLPLTQTSSRPPRNRGARGKGNFQKYGLDGTGFRNHCGFRSLCRYDPPCLPGAFELCACVPGQPRPPLHSAPLLPIFSSSSSPLPTARETRRESTMSARCRLRRAACRLLFACNAASHNVTSHVTPWHPLARSTQ